MNLPWFQFFYADWLSDSSLTACSPVTRGIWIDLICRMHDLDRRGSISGTLDQLARLGRCTAVEMSASLDELELSRAADVTRRNGVVTVTNRRMQREYDQRLSTAKRVAKSRCNGDVTPNVTGDVTPKKPPRNGVESESESEGERAPPTPSKSEKPPDAATPTLAEVVAYCGIRGIDPKVGQRVFDYYEGNRKWFNAFGRLINWQYKLGEWAAKDRENGFKTNGVEQPELVAAKGSKASAADIRKECQR